MRLKIEAADFKPIADAIIESFRGWIDDGAGPQWRLDSPNHEGVRVQVRTLPRLYLFRCIAWEAASHVFIGLRGARIGVRVRREGGEECVQVWDEAGEVQTGWALLRASLHDPLIVINAESDNKGGARLRACVR